MSVGLDLGFVRHYVSPTVRLPKFSLHVESHSIMNQSIEKRLSARHTDSVNITCIYLINYSNFLFLTTVLFFFFGIIVLSEITSGPVGFFSLCRYNAEAFRPCPSCHSANFSGAVLFTFFMESHVGLRVRRPGGVTQWRWYQALFPLPCQPSIRSTSTVHFFDIILVRQYVYLISSHHM